MGLVLEGLTYGAQHRVNESSVRAADPMLLVYRQLLNHLGTVLPNKIFIFMFSRSYMEAPKHESVRRIVYHTFSSKVDLKAFVLKTS